MPGIGIITNPNSRRNRRNPERMRRLGYILGKDNTRHELTKDPEDIYRVAERFLEHEVDILALNGGDGTNHLTLTTFIEVYGDTPLPRIAFLRGGTMNTISNAVGIKGKPGQILLNVSEKYHLGQPFEISERNIMRVDFDGTTKYGFIFGNGVIYNFLAIYYGTGKPSPWVAFTTLTKLTTSAIVGGALARETFRPFRARVTLDDRVWEPEEFTAVLGMSIEQIGLGFRPATRCRTQPDHVNVLGIVTNAIGLATQLPRIRLGMKVPDDKMLNEIARRVTFDADEPLEFTIDGDLHRAESGEVTITAGPRLQIIVK